jgi:hypothetical protein
METITKQTRFNELFGEAMRVFEENTLVWRYGMTTEQGSALRWLCAEYHVAFEPHDYAPLVSRPGAFAGRVGGRDHPDNPYVSVSPDGEVRFT